MSKEFYERPMVIRLTEIFDHPQPPKQVTQHQFDQAQERLVRTAKKAWHEIDESDYWHYLLDLCYVDLQQDLFDYLFPAFLIKWWEGQLKGTGGPHDECDFYRSVDHGKVLTKMMDPYRRQQVLSWMTDAYLQGVDRWGGYAYADNLLGPLGSFNALGQSIPITGPILDRLAAVSTRGRAQWWLVLATDLAWSEDDLPDVPPYTSFVGGGNALTYADAAIVEHGYLDKNLDAMKAGVTLETLHQSLEDSVKVLESTNRAEWAKEALRVLRRDPEAVSTTLDYWMHQLSLPHLGE